MGMSASRRYTDKIHLTIFINATIIYILEMKHKVYTRQFTYNTCVKLLISLPMSNDYKKSKSSNHSHFAIQYHIQIPFSDQQDVILQHYLY